MIRSACLLAITALLAACAAEQATPIKDPTPPAETRSEASDHKEVVEVKVRRVEDVESAPSQDARDASASEARRVEPATEAELDELARLMDETAFEVEVQKANRHAERLGLEHPPRGYRYVPRGSSKALDHGIMPSDWGTGSMGLPSSRYYLDTIVVPPHR